MKIYKDISFKTLKERDLFMDIYVPEVENPPVIMWIHGGSWKELNRTWNLVMPLLDRGYAVAAVDYRYCDEGIFPVQMIDLKDALLYIRKHASEYGYDGSKIAVSGDSAGGHLGTLLGVSAGNKDWETQEGDYSVQAVIDMCGPIHLPLFYQGNEPGIADAITEFIGIPAASKSGLGRAAAANPLTYINGSEPPFLILHGSEDPLVSPEQSRLLRNALENSGSPVMMYLIPGGLHAFAGQLVTDIMQEFLDYYLKGKTTVKTPAVEQCHGRTIPYYK